MKARFSEIKKFRTLVHPQIGNFALEVESYKDVHWDHCREQFASKFNDQTAGFYFAHPQQKAHDVGEFLTKFEIICNVEFNSIFSETEKPNIMWVEPSRFWKNCPLKRSLLTLLIRCGINYNAEIDNFDDALFGDYKETLYLRETKPAILRFLFGFTRFTGKITIHQGSTVIKHGWREEFYKADDHSIRKKLILPENIKLESTIVGLETLWN